jgi:hypothetical protein
MSPAAPLVAWQGWDLRGGASADQAAVALGRQTSREAGAVYDLLAVAGRGFRPPRFLTATPVTEDSGAGPGAGDKQDNEELRLSWALVYRRVAETGPTMVTPYAIYLLGVDPPDGATEEELQTFNDFYTDVHLPEVAERRHALRAERYELARAVRPPYRGAPRFLAAYEVDETGASNRRHRGPPYAKGPDVWQRHTTPWRLWYRRLPAGGT